MSRFFYLAQEVYMVTPTDNRAKDTTASNREDVTDMMTKIKWGTPGQCKNSSTPEKKHFTAT
jgi:hypothetical protein